MDRTTRHRTASTSTVAAIMAGALVPVGIAAVNAGSTTTATTGASAPLQAAPGGAAAGIVPGSGPSTRPGAGTGSSGGVQTMPGLPDDQDRAQDPGSSGSGGSSAGGWGRRGSVAGRARTSGLPLASAKGVVLIDTELPGGTGAGTGITLTSSGSVLTNYHVVHGATAITVQDSTTKRSYPASVVGFDETHDIAVLQLKDASGLSVAVVNETMPSTGEAVTAVGQGGGQGVLYAASGTVTALDEQITAGEEGDPSGAQSLSGLIETDADVVPGYSGGPLVDSRGRVVGVATAASSGREINGYAVPITKAVEIAEQIRAGERSDTVHVGPRAGLGVSVSTSTQVDGAGVVAVSEGSAAASAGVTRGAVITGLDGRAVTSASALTKAMGRYYPGATVTLTWTDAQGAEHSGPVTLGTGQTA